MVNTLAFITIYFVQLKQKMNGQQDDSILK